MTRSARGLLGLLAAAATSLVLVGQFGRSLHTFDQFNALLPLLLPCLALAFAAAIGLRDRATIVVALVGLAVGGVQLGAEALATPVQSSTARPVKLLTFSTFHGNRRPEAMRAVIAAEDPDLVLLQEADGNARDVVTTLLPSYYRIKQCRWQYCHLVILSRWPLRRVAVRFAKRGPHPTILMGEVEAPFGTFRVVNLHMPRPYKPEAEDALRQLGIVARAAPERPLIMAGDFNTATGSFGLSRFAVQAGLARHEGFIPTYPADRLVPAFAGIDHVFADPRWLGGGCHRMAAAHSDHHGIVCVLQLRAEGGKRRGSS
jgi:endonuclease/exonuclease/phosphatase (EEP) superfamily protein YafD